MDWESFQHSALFRQDYPYQTHHRKRSLHLHLYLCSSVQPHWGRQTVLLWHAPECGCKDSTSEIVIPLGDRNGQCGRWCKSVRVRFGKWSGCRRDTDNIPILTSKHVSPLTLGKVFSACVPSALLHGSEAWAPTAPDLQKLQRNDRAMIR